MTRQLFQRDPGRRERLAEILSDQAMREAIEILRAEAVPVATPETRGNPNVGTAQFHESSGKAACLRSLLALAEKPTEAPQRVAAPRLKPDPEEDFQ